MEEINISAAIEAILFSSGDSVEKSRIAQALEITEKQVDETVDKLIDDYSAQNRGITIIKLDSAYQMTAVKEYAPQIRTVMDLRRNTPLSQAALEVLAVVAYNQPVTKAYIEQIRGVDCTGVISTLCQRGLLEEKGRLALPGKPLLYGTTPDFLRCFCLESLSELPELPEKHNDDDDDDDEIDSSRGEQIKTFFSADEPEEQLSQAQNND